MNYKQYLKIRYEVPIMMMVMLAFAIWVCCVSFTENLVFTIASISFMVLLVVVMSIFDYKRISNQYKYIMEQNKSEEELYQNMTFDKLVDILYENEAIDIVLAGCPEEYNDEQAEEWLKDYIEKLVKNKTNK